MWHRKINTRRLRNIIAIGLLFQVLGAAPLEAQVDSSAAGNAAGQDHDAVMTRNPGPDSTYATSLSSSVFLQPTIIFRKNAKPISGFFIDMLQDSLVLQSRGNITTIPFTDAIRMMLPGRKVSGRTAVYGMFLGAYILDLLVWTSESRPGMYADMSTDETSDFISSNFGYAAMGGCLGYLLGLMGDSNEESFTFTGHDRWRRMEEERFRQYVKESKTDASVNFTIQVSNVKPQETERARRIFSDEGFTTEASGYSWASNSRWSSERSPISLFRKGQVTFGIKPGFTVGAAFMNLTEPRYADGSYSDGFYSSVGDTIGSLEITSELTAWYAVGTYAPMHKKWTGSFEWLIGAGLGMVDNSSEAVVRVTRQRYPFEEVSREEQSLPGSLLSVMVFTDLRAYLYPSLSIALTAEYVYVDPITLEPMENFVTKETQLRFSSMSWGLVLGLHF